MLHHRFTFLGSLLLPLFFTPSLRADATADARKAIEANYAKMDASAQAGDFKAEIVLECREAK